MAQSLSPMAKAIRNLAYRHGTYNVFADFCEMAACSFSNAVDKRNFEAREERYMTIVRKYTQEEVNVFPQLLGMLSEALEVGPRDVMGELFHELELHNEHAGQFFTPFPLCEMMARITHGDTMKQTVEEEGFITLQEPACGSGAMVIAFAKTMFDQKINFQQCLHVSAIDLDSRCVHMAYLQFSLLHIPAVVYAGNTLTMEIRDAWYTPAHILGGWNWRLRAADRPASEGGQMETIIEKVMELTEEPASAPAVKPAKGNAKKTAKKPVHMGQLTLF